MRTYGQDTERPDGLKVPSECIWVPQFLLRVEKSQGHLHPAIHLLSVTVPITSKTKVDGAGGQSGTLHLCFRAAE